MNKAQSSLEFLILLAASSAILLVLVATFRMIFFAGLFALDIQTANGFLSELNEKADKLSFFGEGSFLKAHANFFGSVSVFSGNGFLAIEVKSPLLSQSKIIRQETTTNTLVAVSQTNGTLFVELLRTTEGVLIKNGEG